MSLFESNGFLGFEEWRRDSFFLLICPSLESYPSDTEDCYGIVLLKQYCILLQRPSATRWRLLRIEAILFLALERSFDSIAVK